MSRTNEEEQNYIDIQQSDGWVARDMRKILKLLLQAVRYFTRQYTGNEVIRTRYKYAYTRHNLERCALREMLYRKTFLDTTKNGNLIVIITIFFERN